MGHRLSLKPFCCRVTGEEGDPHAPSRRPRFRLDPKAIPPYYTYEMNDTDLRDILAEVTEGKTRSDFMTVATHAHQFADVKGGERGTTYTAGTAESRIAGEFDGPREMTER